ncbi:MAG: hypothetical protein ACP5MB_11050, partial [bacterium]
MLDKAVVYASPRLINPVVVVVPSPYPSQTKGVEIDAPSHNKPTLDCEDVIVNLLFTVAVIPEPA